MSLSFPLTKTNTYPNSIIFMTITLGTCLDVLIVRCMGPKDDFSSRANFVTFLLPALNAGLEISVGCLVAIKRYAGYTPTPLSHNIPLHEIPTEHSATVETDSHQP